MPQKPVLTLPEPIDGSYFFDSRWEHGLELSIMPLELMKMGKPYIILSVGHMRNEFIHGVETVKVLIDVGTKKHRAFVKRTECGPSLKTPYTPIWS